jgi:NAD(P)H-quinone oxidoreductase subunit 4
VTIFLSALGLILTPVYLLSMLRQIFYNSGLIQDCDIAPSCDITDLAMQGQGNQDAVCFGNSCVMPSQAEFRDAQPREIAIAACFLVPIIVLGCYPKLAMQMYDAKTVAVNAQLRQAYAQAHAPTYAQHFLAPPLSAVPRAALSSILK